MTDSTQKREFDAPTLQTTADGAIAALERAGSNAVALVEAWVKTSNASAVAEAAHSASGAARKAARRGINVLKSRKVPVPERHTVAKLVASEEETLHAWLLPPDTNGTVLLAVSARAPSRSHRAAFVYVHDSLGVQRVETGSLSQSQLRESFNKAAPGKTLKPVEVPVEWARWRIAQARLRHAERGIPEPLGFASAAKLLEPVPAEAPPNPFDEEGLVLDDDDAKEIGSRSWNLHTLEEFRSWLPSRPAVDEMLREVGKQLTPSVEPPDDEMKEKLEQQIVAATDRYFSPERREGLVRAMKDAGLSVLARSGEQKALEVVAAIKLVEGRGLITDPPHEVGFLRAFFDKAVSVVAHQNGGNLRIPIPQANRAAAAHAAPPVAADTEPTQTAEIDDSIGEGTAEETGGDAATSPTIDIDAGWDGNDGSKT